MKRMKLYIALLCIICAHRGLAQDCNGVYNNQFAITGSAYNPNTCYFGENYVTNWHRSHGTPQYHRNTSDPNASSMYMWSTYDGGLGGRGPVGEGIWAPYTFLANHQYTIKVAAYNDGDNGDLVVVAANNVPTTYMTICEGEDLPSVTGTSVIMNQFLQGFSSSYTEYFVTFTPTVNYSQVWIYPSTWDYRVQMYVDYISICENNCTGSLVYNSGSMPGGETRAGMIFAGSSSGWGGSGTVTAQNGITTSLIAGHEVWLQPNFHVQLTYGEFRALVYECPPVQTKEQPSKYPSVQAQLDPRGLVPARAVSTKRSDSTRVTRAPASMAVYPNPAKSRLNVQLNNFTGNITGMQVLNEIGIVVQQIDRKAYANKQILELDISHLPSGMYILKTTTDAQTFTQKFQKLK